MMTLPSRRTRAARTQSSLFPMPGYPALLTAPRRTSLCLLATRTACCPQSRDSPLSRRAITSLPVIPRRYCVLFSSPLMFILWCRKTPGTEDGVLEPIPTFSTCYSAPFIILHVCCPSHFPIRAYKPCCSPRATPLCLRSVWPPQTPTAA